MTVIAAPTSMLARQLRRSRLVRDCVNGARRIRAFRHEQSIGIDTITMPADAQGATIRCADATWYDVMDYAVLRRYLRPLNLASADVVVDVGCGMGRILCECAQRNVARCIGIEIDPALAERARQNAVSLRPRHAPIDVYTADATTFNYDDVNVIVLFNPFGAVTCRKMLDAVHESLMRRPRRLRFGYFNPACADVFNDQQWLQFDGECRSPRHHYSAMYWSSR